MPLEPLTARGGALAKIRATGLLILGFGTLLRENELQFAARKEGELGTGLGAYANPVEACRSGPSAIGLYSHLESDFVESANGGTV